MSLHRFFLEDQIIADEGAEAFALRLAPDDARHARVLRLEPGEHIAVVDGASDYFECEVVSFDDDLTVRVCGHADAPELPDVVLVQGLAKGDKMDAVIRQATELGVAAFMPVACERSVVKLDAKKAAGRHARWQAIAKSAAMQSGQPRIPEVAPVGTLAEAADALAEATCTLVCWEEAEGGLSVGEAVRRGMEACGASCPEDARVAVVVGPEGGLTDGEVAALEAAGSRTMLVTLGPTILRTETAGVVASALALYELGGLGNREARGNR